MHEPHLVPEIRTLAPDENGWARHEKTGRACAVCPCGLNTGFVDSRQATDAYRSHVCAGQKIRIALTGGEALTSFIRDRTRKH